MAKKNRTAPAPIWPKAQRSLRKAQLKAKRWITGPIAKSLTEHNNLLAANFKSFIDDNRFTIWGLALLIGPAIAYAAIGFRLLIGNFQWVWLGTADERMLAAAAATPWWIVVLVPTCAGLAVGWVLDRHMPGKRAHSVADVIEARNLSDSRIDPKVGILSALLSAFSLGCGASAGREGPVVHLGATLTSWIEGRFSLSRSARSTLLAAGVAAAISASFNAPIAGVLFAHEVILQHYALRSFVPIVIASVAAGIVTRIHFANTAAFIIPNYDIASFWEFPAFLILGVVCALAAIMFQLSIRMTGRLIGSVDVSVILRAGFGGLMVGLIAIWLPQVLGVGYEATDRALSQQYSLGLLFLLIAAKTAATSITLATNFSTGIFSPALYIGAMTGAAFGIIATGLVPESSSSASLYAILGMGGVAAAVLGAPISTTMIVFELTGGFKMAIALLVTISISTGLTQAILGHSYFHWQLKKRGLSLFEGPHKAILRRTLVADFMVPISQLSEFEQLDALDAPALKPTDSLEHALRTFSRSGATLLPVTDPGDGDRIIGKAQRVTALNAYNQALVAAHEEEHR